MILAWMVYAAVVAALAGGAARVVDALLRSHRRSTRWVWLGAMLFSVIWPLGTVFGPRGNDGPPPTSLAAPVLALEALTVRVAEESLLHGLDGPLTVLWIATSAILFGFALLLLVRTHWLRKRWTGEEAGGRTVLISEEWGPAVVGILDPQIVLPRWCRALEDSGLRLILEHEAEHLRARDLHLLVLAGLLPLLFPWNPALWWQWGRLRLAAEGDCDLRVLERNPRATRAYLDLLLEVARRFPPRNVAAAMLSEPERTLRRRIQIMTMPIPRRPWIRGILLAVLGAGLVAVACWAPGPTDLDRETVVPPDQAETSGQVSSRVEDVKDLSRKPAFTPMTVQPDIKNGAELARAVVREYPPLLRDAGIGGTTQVWFFIDETGAVQDLRLDTSSGHEALDEAALRVAELVEFTPAMNQDERVPVWISLPIKFTTR